jgi:protein-arginine kinase activator protein McsA
MVAQCEICHFHPAISLVTVIESGSSREVYVCEVHRHVAQRNPDRPALVLTARKPPLRHGPGH